MDNIDRDIQIKREEIAALTQMLENAKKDLKLLEKRKDKPKNLGGKSK